MIDCNRPPHVASSIPRISEATTIPGNEGLSREAAAIRRREIFDPYHRRIEEIIDQRLRDRQADGAGRAAQFHAGLCRHRAALAHRHALSSRHQLPPLLLKLLRAEADLVVGDNEPYAVSDETDYTIPVHGEARGLINTGIEIRQDLIADQAGQQQWAERLARIFGEIEATLRAAGLIWILARPRQREPDAAADHEAAGDARQQPRPPRREERPRAAGEQRVDRHRSIARDHHEGDAEQRHLRDMILAHVHELRNEGAEEHQHFRVRQQHQKALQEKPAARRRRRRVGIDAFDRKANQLDAEPDQIGGTCKAHPVEPVAHGRHQRGQADRDDADHDRKARPARPGYWSAPRGCRGAGRWRSSASRPDREAAQARCRRRQRRDRLAGTWAGALVREICVAWRRSLSHAHRTLCEGCRESVTSVALESLIRLACGHLPRRGEGKKAI